jgi:predicted GIY-YIG superfamily endonuclease
LLAKKICGVYKITNAANGKFYVGSSKDIQKRWDQHIGELNDGTHRNYHLQNAWIKYGSQNFKFEIIEECSLENQFEREQFYLNTLNPFDDSGYNIVRQISKEYMSDNYMIKKCERCTREYHTFSHLSKYCDECKEEMAKENWENFQTEVYWMRGSGMCFSAMYDGYENADDFWESNS